jgi:hypothetical protein
MTNSHDARIQAAGRTKIDTDGERARDTGKDETRLERPQSAWCLSAFAKPLEAKTTRSGESCG